MKKTLFTLMGKKAEYEEMYADALKKYEPVVSNKVIGTGTSSHYSYFPVAGRTNACYLNYEDIKSITSKLQEAGVKIKQEKSKIEIISGDKYGKGKQKAEQIAGI